MLDKENLPEWIKNKNVYKLQMEEEKKKKKSKKSKSESIENGDSK